MEAEYASLKRILRDIGPCVVAFSGGVDSTFLLRVAYDVLGENAMAVLAVSPSLASSEREEAIALARLIGVRCIQIRTREMDEPRYVRNDAERCYFCKRELFSVLKPIADAAGTRAVVYGAILDDLQDDRPGMRAAAQAGARAPLIEAGLTKSMIRALSRCLGLPTWDKPAAACLASRIQRHAPVTAGALALVERAEAAVRALGYRLVRVRWRTEGASVELDPEGLLRSASPVARRRLEEAVLQAGFAAVTIEPRGYRPGGRQEALPPPRP
jgi:pyridinium-3,5-biscarboxylic acid mononucleotide sulfurtransferase